MKVKECVSLKVQSSESNINNKWASLCLQWTMIQKAQKRTDDVWGLGFWDQSKDVSFKICFEHIRCDHKTKTLDIKSSEGFFQVPEFCAANENLCFCFVSFNVIDHFFR